MSRLKATKADLAWPGKKALLSFMQLVQGQLR